MALETEFSKFFFNNLEELRANKRGIAVYHVTTGMVSHFVDECYSRDISTHFIPLSKFSGEQIQVIETELQIIFNDLNYPDYLPLVPRVAKELIHPIYHQGQWSCFFSTLDRAELLKKTVTPNSIHHDYEKVQHFLQAESIVHILDKTTYSFPNPSLEPAQKPFQQEKHFPISQPYELDTNLDAEQMQAIKFTDGPILVMAPAGSGKTRTLTNRITNLINNGIPGERILALAFNRKAMQEMNDRLTKKGITQTHVRTFHAFGYDIIRQKLGWHYEEKRNPKKLRTIIEGVIGQQIPFQNSELEDPLKPFLTNFRKAKLELIPFSDLDVKLKSKPIDFESVFLTILKKQKQTRFLTFDDMIYFPIRILLEEDDFRQAIQESFDYILVDEFQDLNRAQLTLVNILSYPENNLFVVGDDDQMIYGWRGASVDHMLNFPESYPGCKEITLNTNYRSAKKIVRHAGWLIDHQPKRVRKHTQPRHQAPLGILDIRLGDGMWDQANIAADWIIKSKKSYHVQWRDFAILFRTNAHEIPAALALRQRGIPHTPINPLNVYATEVGRDIYHILQILISPSTAPAQAFSRILRFLEISLPSELTDQVTGWDTLQKLPLHPFMSELQKHQLKEFIRIIENLREFINEPDIQPNVLLKRLDEDLNLTAAYLDKSGYSLDMDNANHELVFESILAISQGYPQLRSFYEQLDFILNTSQKESSPSPPNEYENNPENKVHLMTVHKAKGKEFPYVVYFDLSSKRAGRMETNEPEERRVVYVGVTRAINGLLVTTDRQKPAGFLNELALNPDFDDFALAYLFRQSKNTKRNLNRLNKGINKLEREKNSLQTKFPTLNNYVNREQNQSITRSWHWLSKKRLEAATRKQLYLEKESQTQLETLNQLTDLQDMIETEIRFRKLLGEKDDI